MQLYDNILLYSVSFQKGKEDQKVEGDIQNQKQKTKRKATKKKSSNGKLNPGADSEIFQMREFEKIKCMLINAINLCTNKN